MTIRTVHANGRKEATAGLVVCLTPGCQGQPSLPEGQLLTARYRKVLGSTRIVAENPNLTAVDPALQLDMLRGNAFRHDQDGHGGYGQVFILRYNPKTRTLERALTLGLAKAKTARHRPYHSLPLAK